jgi:hypothetical protein
MQFINFATSLLLYFGSGLSCSLEAVLFLAIIYLDTGFLPSTGLGMTLFGHFCAVFTSAPFATGYAGTIQNTANYMIADARQIPDAASANQNRAVLLQVVVDARDVSGYFLAVSQSNAGDFS